MPRYVLLLLQEYIRGCCICNQTLRLFPYICFLQYYTSSVSLSPPSSYLSSSKITFYSSLEPNDHSLKPGSHSLYLSQFITGSLVLRFFLGVYLRIAPGEEFIEHFSKETCLLVMYNTGIFQSHFYIYGLLL